MSNLDIPKRLQSHTIKSRMQSSKKLGMSHPASPGLLMFSCKLQCCVFPEFTDSSFGVDTQLMIVDFFN